MSRLPKDPLAVARKEVINLTGVHVHTSGCMLYMLLSRNCSYIVIEVRVLALFHSIVLLLFIASPVLKRPAMLCGIRVFSLPYMQSLESSNAIYFIPSDTHVLLRGSTATLIAACRPRDYRVASAVVQTMHDVLFGL